MRILFLNLPSPPRTNVYRNYSGGFGIAETSTRVRYGHDPHISSKLIPPLFSAYAAAILERIKFKVNILDGQALDLDVPQLLAEVEKRKPDIIISEVSLPSFTRDLGILNRIKETLPETFLIGWGTAWFVTPKVTFTNSRLDLVVRGELEFTLPSVIETLERGESLHHIRGVSFKHNGDIICNLQRSIVENLDDLPLPAYHLLNMEKYVVKESFFYSESSKEKFVRYFPVLSSRGCPFDCIYCPYPLSFGRVWRAMSPERAVDEIEHLVNNYGVHAILFLDQTFTLDIKRTIEICDEILRRDLDILWTCETRADKLPHELVKKMKKAGCVWIQIGVETGDPQLLSVGKPGYTFEILEQAFRITQEEGILRRAAFLVGLPGESWETIKNTRKLIERISPDDLQVNVVTPYPGTALYEMARKNGWLITNDWEKYTIVDPVMSFEGFTAIDMSRARRYLLDHFRAKRKINRIVAAVRKWRFRNAAEEVKTMILDLPGSARRVYNLIRCGLK